MIGSIHAWLMFNIIMFNIISKELLQHKYTHLKKLTTALLPYPLFVELPFVDCSKLCKPSPAIFVYRAPSDT